MAPKAFVIHGRDLAARDELVKFLNALGVKHLSFEKVAAKLGAAPFVAEVVIEGIKQAAVVLVLFTPEEHASFFDPKTGEYRGSERGEARWQARPNVIFEAGVAMGAARDKTIIVTLGSDVQLFSDVGGLHFVSLTDPDAKSILYRRIKNIVGPLQKVANWEDAANFDQVLRRRWPSFDELDELERSLASCDVGTGGTPLFDVVGQIVRTHSNRDWHRAAPRAFMKAIDTAFLDKELVDDAYWWLVVHGFFRFADIDNWFTGIDPTWKRSVDFVMFSKRALALIDKIKAVA